MKEYAIGTLDEPKRIINLDYERRQMFEKKKPLKLDFGENKQKTLVQSFDQWFENKLF